MKRWWYRHPGLRLMWFGFCNPFWPAPPWAPLDDPRWQKLMPVVRRIHRDAVNELIEGHS